MRVRIARSLADRIVAAAAATPDREVCGLLFGDDRRIDAAIAARNVAVDPARRFEIDPQALFAAFRAQRAGGASVIGCYHSHPDGLAMPSPRDAAAAEPGSLWLIVGGGRIAAFRACAGPAGGGFDPVVLELG